MNRVINFLFVIVIALGFGCGKNTITNPADYEAFMNNSQRESERMEDDASLLFWEGKLQADPDSYINKLNLGYEHLRKFNRRGNVDDLHNGDSLIAASSQLLNNKDPEILYALSQVAISKHQFRASYDLVTKANDAGGDRYTTSLLRFDAAMEIGNYTEASVILNSIVKMDDFDYLIRRSKLDDHLGKTALAVKSMGKAFSMVKDLNRNSIYCWAGTNLADFYSHEGRLSEAYDLYVKVLKRDNNYLHALKGIAWIAFSHDHNTTEAKRILGFIYSRNPQPDLLLLLAEIAEWENDQPEKDRHIQKFMEVVNKKRYGAMYNNYLIQVLTEELQQFEKAIEIAQTEVNSRPTPETYDLLAWAHFHKGDIKKAKAIANTYVRGKTFEPVALYHTAMILKQSGELGEADELFRTCLKSSFELGPVISERIKKEISSS